MREAWAADIEARTARFWTPERTRGLLGDKQLVLPPVSHGPLLRAMGLLKADASMGPESVRKYMQISHMLTLVEPQLRDLAAVHEEVRVLDLACGNSYLTLLLATSFRKRLAHAGKILGVDRNVRLIEVCRERAWRLFLDDILRFEAALIGDLDITAVWRAAFGTSPGDPPVHLLVALHACDTATDDALALGLSLNVEAMAVVPCCQAELARWWAQKSNAPCPAPLSPIWRWPHLRREAAATMTDALRALLLQGCGYHVVPVEFVPSEHTPKNTMIRATRVDGGCPGAFGEYLALRRSLGDPRLHLERAMPPRHQAHLRAAERCA